MDWASKHAATRGYPYARALTTGKTPELGGIPHDTYGPLPCPALLLPLLL